MQSAPFGQGKQKPPFGTGNSECPENVINNFHDIESFLENVLVKNPVSINAELVPTVLSRGLGLSADSSSIGGQGSNDRRQGSGKPWSSVSNGGQGNTMTQNGNVTGAEGRLPKQLRASGGIGPLGETPLVGSGQKRGRDEINNNTTSRNNVNITDDPATGTGEKGKKLHEGTKAFARKEKEHRHDARKKHGHGHTGKQQKQMRENQKQMQWNQEHFQEQLQRQFQQQQQMQQQLQQMQQQNQQAAMAAAYGSSQPNSFPPGGPIGFPGVPPGYMFPGQQPPFSSIPYPFPFPPGDKGARFYGGTEADVHEEDQTTKRSRLVWTEKLHRKFLEAVDACGGVEHALPKPVMKQMKVEGLTRENVSSHLQKYRLRLKKSKDAVDEQHSESK
ncbi:hypothetical protein M9434_002459 [Picochlorum sp. BPE23]|nr:hypothetical protein M9435_006724 [Picochlorum sp. BPE23]KAI8114333.1 hypothetical protein M9434_002459 [Picochlorum sp. BPE23]